MRDVILVAASGLAREVIAAAQDDYRIVGILDDDPALHGTTVGGIAVLGGTAHAAEYDAALLLCVGAGTGRRALAERLRALGIDEHRYATVVDASVRIPSTCSVGAGSILLAGTVMTTDVVIGSNVVVMPNVVLTHDVRLGDFATLASGVSLGGGVSVHSAAYVGMNAAVRQRVVIGAGAIVGMGAAVLEDVPDGETWVGVPAHPIQIGRR
jgi:sugar O-acyltransferase (sialic acid O-acetyltransferase NeuD family)